jgi:hypothetical protein
MPTSRPRHTLTETDELAVALADAARRWPEDQGSRTKLLRRLISEGHRTIVDRRDDLADRRSDAIRRTSGALTGVYEADHLARLRDDWPA